MDLFTGKKIADLRKFRSLSQEALAEKLGVSRQAVSKWERGEASPDMDNLVALAGIFGIGLDDLLGDKKAAEILFPAEEKAPQPTVAETAQTAENQGISAPATETKPEDASAAADKDASENEEKKKSKKALIKKGAEKIKKRREAKKDLPRYRPELADKLKKIPVFLLVPALYVVTGILFRTWHPGWLSILFIPIYYMFIRACEGKDRKSFLYRLPIPFVAIVMFIITGLLFNLWHPGWLVFLCVPLYYAAVWKGVN